MSTVIKLSINVPFTEQEICRKRIMQLRGGELLIERNKLPV